MKRFFFILSVGLMAVSCWSHSDRLKVDIDKALKKQVDVRELYAQAAVIPLHFSEGMTLGQESQPVMEVAADRFFLLDKENNTIRVFNWEGDYLATIDQPEKIIDISAYKDQVLDVLTAGAISEYDIQDGSFLTAYPIRNNEVILTSLARVDEDTIDLKGFLNGRAYDCGYLIGQNRFYTVVNDFYPAVDYQSGRYFHSNDSTFCFCAHSGDILFYTGDDFIFPWYEWDFGKRAPVFTNVQKTTDRIYLAFTLEGKDYMLVYNLDDRKYKVVEYDTFPLGVIYAGRNYYFSPADRAIICHTL